MIWYFEKQKGFYTNKNFARKQEKSAKFIFDSILPKRQSPSIRSIFDALDIRVS